MAMAAGVASKPATKYANVDDADADLDSPGYEYLRSYQNMINLHTKLLVLNYEKEFCLFYKCPPIHRFYFSLPCNNPGEQRFVFTCLCAWLIKEKCHMNLEIEPEEYQDLEVILGVVIEALRLITDDDGNNNGGKSSGESTLNWCPNQSRLRRGYGPEVVWTLSIFADRALEMILDQSTGSTPPIKQLNLVYKQSGPMQEKQNSITIGQPFVGGGLTTRPLGNYIIDDKSLLLDEGANHDDGAIMSLVGDPSDSKQRTKSMCSPDVDAHEWYRRVESSRHILESVRFDDDDDDSDDKQSARFEDWSEEIRQVDEAKKCVESFLDKSRLTLESTARQIDRQLQLIGGREKYLQAQLRDRLDDFLVIWRKYSLELAHNKELVAQVDARTDEFVALDNRLQTIQARIEARKRNLNDGSKLDELRVMIDRLKSENREYDTRTGLLLAVYFKLDS